MARHTKTPKPEFNDMLIYSGLGLLGIPVYLASFALYFFTLLFLGFWNTDGDFFKNNFLRIFVGIIFACLIAFVFGKFLNRKPAYQEVITGSGRELRPFAAHTLFHLPVEFSGLIITASAIFVYLIRNFL